MLSLDDGLGLAERLILALDGMGAEQALALAAAIPELRTALWVITHKELGQTMRIKVVMQAIGPALAHAVKVPAGKSQGPTAHG